MSTHPFAADFDRLEPGARVETGGRTITEADLVSFAALTGDRHPQHADAVWAAASPFGERIAHGMLVLSYALGMLPIDPRRVVALRGVRDAVFKRPAPIGTTIAVEAEVARLRALDAGHGLVELALRVRDERRRLLARATLEALWRRGVDRRTANGDRAEAAEEAEAEPAAWPEGRVLL